MSALPPGPFYKVLLPYPIHLPFPGPACSHPEAELGSFALAGPGLGMVKLWMGQRMETGRAPVSVSLLVGLRHGPGAGRAALP